MPTLHAVSPMREARTGRKRMSTSDETLDSPSKTRRKQAMTELQDLGEQLVALTAERLRKLVLPDELRSAVEAARRMIRHDEGRRRQIQYVGRLMRGVDAAPIREALSAVRGESAEEIAKLHRIERLRAELLADERILTHMARLRPAADLQRLRALRRSALLEQEQGKPPRCYRAIFQMLKELEEQATNARNEHDDPK